jgi:hypothetical protein
MGDNPVSCMNTGNSCMFEWLVVTSPVTCVLKTSNVVHFFMFWVLTLVYECLVDNVCRMSCNNVSYYCVWSRPRRSITWMIIPRHGVAFEQRKQPLLHCWIYRVKLATIKQGVETMVMLLCRHFKKRCFTSSITDAVLVHNSVVSTTSHM